MAGEMNVEAIIPGAKLKLREDVLEYINRNGYGKFMASIKE
jgi:hypothetical protein